jgi:hypothetical protein
LTEAVEEEREGEIERNNEIEVRSQAFHVIVLSTVHLLQLLPLLLKQHTVCRVDVPTAASASVIKASFILE